MIKLVRETCKKDYYNDFTIICKEATYHYNTEKEKEEHCATMIADGYNEGASDSFSVQLKDGTEEHRIATYYSKQETVKNCTSENTEKIF